MKFILIIIRLITIGCFDMPNCVRWQSSAELGIRQVTRKKMRMMMIAITKNLPDSNDDN